MSVNIENEKPAKKNGNGKRFLAAGTGIAVLGVLGGLYIHGARGENPAQTNAAEAKTGQSNSASLNPDSTANYSELIKAQSTAEVQAFADGVLKSLEEKGIKLGGAQTATPEVATSTPTETATPTATATLEPTPLVVKVPTPEKAVKVCNDIPLVRDDENPDGQSLNISELLRAGAKVVVKGDITAINLDTGETKVLHDNNPKTGAMSIFSTGNWVVDATFGADVSCVDKSSLTGFVRDNVKLMEEDGCVGGCDEGVKIFKQEGDEFIQVDQNLRPVKEKVIATPEEIVPEEEVEAPTPMTRKPKKIIATATPAPTAEVCSHKDFELNSQHPIFDAPAGSLLLGDAEVNGVQVSEGIAARGHLTEINRTSKIDGTKFGGNVQYAFSSNECRKTTKEQDIREILSNGCVNGCGEVEIKDQDQNVIGVRRN